MTPKFKYYFYPFLYNLKERETCRLYDLTRYIGQDLKLTDGDLEEYTKGGRVTKHSSRVNYCASYLKKMGLVETFSAGTYQITSVGRKYLRSRELTNARALLADYSPVRHSRLFCTRWNGMDKANGVMDALDDEESYSLFFVSMMIVTGPSFTSATFMSAPNSPVGTGFPIASESFFTKAS